MPHAIAEVKNQNIFYERSEASRNIRFNILCKIKAIGDLKRYYVYIGQIPGKFLTLNAAKREEIASSFVCSQVTVDF